MWFSPGRLLVATGVCFAVACAESPTSPSRAMDPSNALDAMRGSSNAGTTLSATKSANGFYESRVRYDWTLTKRVKTIMDEKFGLGMFALPSTSAVEIPKGEVRWIEYEMTATRDNGTPIRSTGVRGTVCVTNGGAVPTKDLQILDVVQTKMGGGHFQDMTSQLISVAAKPVLGPGESYCYPYEIAFAATPGAQYRNTARVTITNHSGHIATPFGPAANGGGVKADFTVPSALTTGAPIDADATLHDNIGANNQSSSIAPCSAIFYRWWCSTESPNEWNLTSSTTVTYVLDMHNFFACGDSFDFPNSAVLTEGATSLGGSKRQVVAGTVLHITSGACTTQPTCTQNTGYWKDPSHSWPDQTSGYAIFAQWNWTIRNTDPFFDQGITWQQVLNQSAAGNTYRALAQSYVTASLNDASGAHMPNDVRTTYLAVGRYFALSPSERSVVSNQVLSAWQNVLAAFNAGHSGVRSCVESE